RPFLAMASLKSYRLWASSFGLTKRLNIRPTFSRHGLDGARWPWLVRLDEKTGSMPPLAQTAQKY
ncbi:MAG: hypothetical protein U0L68_00520, partial [Prevotellamassilia sp.]|nr:hypothetical protein [Prevotellamassilia sp.]